MCLFFILSCFGELELEHDCKWLQILPIRALSHSLSLYFFTRFGFDSYALCICFWLTLFSINLIAKRKWHHSSSVPFLSPSPFHFIAHWLDLLIREQNAKKKQNPVWTLNFQYHTNSMAHSLEWVEMVTALEWKEKKRQMEKNSQRI